MADQESEQEPTMEEILASIRRIISEEDETPAEEAVSEEPAAEVVQDEPELSAPEEHEGEESEGEEFQPPQEVYEDDPVTENALKEDYVDKGVDNPVIEEPSPMAPDEPVVRDAPEIEEGLLSADAAVAASAAFGDLNRTLTVSLGEGKTVEAIVGDLLRPLLKSWLDQHLPPLVEQMVQEEIERLARRRRPS